MQATARNSSHYEEFLEPIMWGDIPESVIEYIVDLLPLRDVLCFYKVNRLGRASAQRRFTALHKFHLQFKISFKRMEESNVFRRYGGVMDKNIDILTDVFRNGAFPGINALDIQCNKLSGGKFLRSFHRVAFETDAFIHLQSLNLSHTYLGNESIPYFSAMMSEHRLRELVELRMETTGITQKGLFARGQLPNIQMLNIDGNEFNADAVTELTDACKRGSFPQLYMLIVKETACKDTALIKSCRLHRPYIRLKTSYKYSSH